MGNHFREEKCSNGQKRKTLPADFGELVKSGDVDALKAVFEKCDWDATLGYYKEPALSMRQIPDELVRWLVEQGADINARDKYQRTPLYSQAGTWSGNIPLFLELGAELEALDYQNQTPLHAAVNYYRTQAVRDLVAHGANVHAVNKSGTPRCPKLYYNAGIAISIACWKSRRSCLMPERRSHRR